MADSKLKNINDIDDDDDVVEQQKLIKKTEHLLNVVGKGVFCLVLQNSMEYFVGPGLIDRLSSNPTQTAMVRALKSLQDMSLLLRVLLRLLRLIAPLLSALTLLLVQMVATKPPQVLEAALMWMTATSRQVMITRTLTALLQDQVLVQMVHSALMVPVIAQMLILVNRLRRAVPMCPLVP